MLDLSLAVVAGALVVLATAEGIPGFAAFSQAVTIATIIGNLVAYRRKMHDPAIDAFAYQQRWVGAGVLASVVFAVAQGIPS